MVGLAIRRKYNPTKSHKIPSFPKSPTNHTFPNPSPAYPQEIPKLPQSLTPRALSESVTFFLPDSALLTHHQPNARDRKIRRGTLRSSGEGHMPASGRSGEGTACRNRPRKARLMPRLRPTSTRRPRWNYSRTAGRNACEIRPPSSYGGGPCRQEGGTRLSGGRWEEGTTPRGRIARPSARHPQGALIIGLGGGDCPLARSGLLWGCVCGDRPSRSRCTGPDGLAPSLGRVGTGPVWGWPVVLIRDRAKGTARDECA